LKYSGNTKKEFSTILKKEKLLIGMLHIPALPGTPNSSLNINQIIKKVLIEAEIYKKAGLKTVMLENMHDVPYTRGFVDPVVTAIMSIAAFQIRKNFDLFCGIQILAAANTEAVAVAHASGCHFIRVENFIYAHVADEGWMEACAGELLRYRRKISAENVLIFTDIQKKHSSHSITADLDLNDWIETAEFFGSDGIIITGKKTSDPPDLEVLHNINCKTKLPIILGSGITAENISLYWDYADGFIVGSYFKENGKWYNSVSELKIKDFMKIFRESSQKRKE